jgi:serine/threonine protein kinase
MEASYQSPTMFKLNNDLFHVDQELGRGNYAVVCRAKWTTKDEHFVNAIKLLYGSDNEFKQGYLDAYVREILCSSLLKYRSGVLAFTKPLNVKPNEQVYDFGILMREANFSLRSLINYCIIQRPPLCALQMIAKKCIEGLKLVHDSKVIHRDVKPENILIYLDKDMNFDIELIDFSLSTCSLVSNHKNVVTLWWRPLELLMKDTVHSSTVDVWALGIILVEIMTGRNVFRGQRNEDRMAQIIFHYWGYPQESEWPELHEHYKELKLDKMGKCNSVNLVYGMYMEETVYYQQFMGILHDCFILNGSEIKSCDYLLKHDFFQKRYPIRLLKINDLSFIMKNN